MSSRWVAWVSTSSISTELVTIVPLGGTLVKLWDASTGSSCGGFGGARAGMLTSAASLPPSPPDFGLDGVSGTIVLAGVGVMFLFCSLC